MADYQSKLKHGSRADGANGLSRRLEWLSIAYICTCVGLLAAVMGGSQALKTEVIEDALSLIAPILFLVGARISAHPPTTTYPFGYERATSAAYFGAALALLATGLFLFCDGAIKLMEAEHPIIGGIPLFGHVVWIGWPAIPVLLWCAIPAWLLGRRKQKLAKHLSDKGLLADAQTNTANWQSAGAAIIGVSGVAAGLWWADALAAVFISFEIIRSGWTEVKTALADLMDRRPQQFGERAHDPLPEKLTHFLLAQDWIEDAVVRVREKGRELTAEAFIVPRRHTICTADLDMASAGARKLDERLHHVSVVATEHMGGEIELVRLKPAVKYCL